VRQDDLEGPRTSEQGVRRLIVASAHLSKNPLIIALAAALLGNFLIPRILDRAETNRRALDLKANLAKQMGGSVEAVLTQGELFARGVMKKTNVDSQAAFNDGWSDWRSGSAEVDAQLTAYFGADEAGKAFTTRWRELRTAIDAMYFLSGTGLKGARCELVDAVNTVLELRAPRTPRCNKSALSNWKYQKRKCLAKDATRYDLLAVCDADDRKTYGYQRGPRFSETYTDTSAKLLARGRSLVQELVDLTPSGF
jgi:hypothetical protein